MGSAGTCRIGVLLPDDGGDSEWLRVNEWLRRRLADRAEVRILLTPSDGLHDVLSLLETGRHDMLAAKAKELAAGNCDAIVWACTSGSFVGGFDWARRQAAAMTAATGLPATSTSLALAAAARRLRAPDVDLLSPYPQAVTARLVAFLGDAGVAVATAASLDCASGLDSRRLDLPAVVAGHRAATGTAVRPLMIPDTAIDSLNLVEALEANSNRPLITANQASLWHGLALAGCDAAIADAGLLLRSPGV